MVALAVSLGAGCAQVGQFHHQVGDTFDRYAENQQPGMVQKAARFGGWGWHTTGKIADKVLGVTPSPDKK